MPPEDSVEQRFEGPRQTERIGPPVLGSLMITRKSACCVPLCPSVHAAFRFGLRSLGPIYARRMRHFGHVLR